MNTRWKGLSLVGGVVLILAGCQGRESQEMMNQTSYETGIQSEHEEVDSTMVETTTDRSTQNTTTTESVTTKVPPVETSQSPTSPRENQSSLPGTSVFQAWSPAEGLSEDSWITMARHDLVFCDTWTLGTGWEISEEQPWTMLSVNLFEDLQTTAMANRKRLQSYNPDIKILCALNYREGYLVPRDEELSIWEKSWLPKDSPFWLRKEDGTIAPGWGEDENSDGILEEEEIQYGLIDFTNPKFQDIFVQKVIALKKSGLFDGIMLDWWAEDHSTSANLDWSATYLTAQEELQARLSILKKIRKALGEDFLILVNSNQFQMPASAPYINGLFMECYKKNWHTPYTREDILQIESTLRWAESSLAKPRINCLEGWRELNSLDQDLNQRVNERNTTKNLQWMRLFTSMSLVFSDGYVLFSDDNAMPTGDHLHNWYDFWNLPLGEPLGMYQELEEGCYLREYQSASVIYNRSGHQITYQGTKIPDLDGVIIEK